MFDMSNNTKKYCSEYCKCYDDYLQEPWGAWFTQEVGTRILKHMSKTITMSSTLKVLEVGSGKASKTYRNLFGDTPHPQIEYVTIDKNPECNPTYVYDILDHAPWTNMVAFLEPDYFDIVIIDVEPHGKEDEIYSRIKHAIKDPALVIFKCIGHMDMYGSSLAKKMLHAIHAEHKVEDALLLSYDEHVTLLSMMFRDMYIAYGSKGYKGRINQLLLGLKERQVTLTPGTITPVDLMCLMYGWECYPIVHKLQTYVTFHMLPSEKHAEFQEEFMKIDHRDYIMIASTSPDDPMTMRIFQETVDKIVFVIEYTDNEDTRYIHMKHYNGHHLDKILYKSERLRFLFDVAQNIKGIRNIVQENAHERNTAENKHTIDINLTSNSNTQVAV